MQEALRHAPVREVYFCRDSAPDVVAEARRRGVAVYEVTEPVMDALSDTRTPQGIVAVVEAPAADLGSVEVRSGLVTVLAEVRDPGNAGTLVRSSVAAGCDAIVFTAGSVDPLNPKTVRASAGTLFAATVVADVSLEAAANALRERGFALVGADAGSSDRVADVDVDAPIALVLGNEAWGLGAGSRGILDHTVGIPMPGPVESLNVGIAGSILLFDVVRRRSERSGGA